MGKQDSPNLHGINEYTFKPNGKVIVNNLGLSKAWKFKGSSLMYLQLF